jgi:hypothetical protein
MIALVTRILTVAARFANAHPNVIRLIFLTAMVFAVWLGVLGAVVLFTFANTPAIFIGAAAGTATWLWIASHRSESRS